MVRLGQAEAADPFAGRQLRQILLLGRLVAELIDRHHDERGLHAHHRAIAGIDTLDFARDQAVGDVVQAGAAVLFRDGRAEQAQFAHLAEDRGVHGLVAEGIEDARLQLVLAVGGGRVAHHALFVGQLLVEQQRVIPVEGGLAGGSGHGSVLSLSDSCGRAGRRSQGIIGRAS